MSTAAKGSDSRGTEAAAERNGVQAGHHICAQAKPYTAAEPGAMTDSRRRVAGVRLSTIGFHPNISKVPHSKSSTPHPKTDFSKTQMASCSVIPWLEYTTYFLNRNKIGIPMIFG